MDLGDDEDKLDKAIEKRVNAKLDRKESQAKEKSKKKVFGQQQKPGANTRKEWSKSKIRWKQIRRELSAKLSVDLASEAGVNGEAYEKVPHHMEQEGRNHYNDQDSYHNRSHHCSRSRLLYEEDDYNYYYDPSYATLCILRTRRDPGIPNNARPVMITAKTADGDVEEALEAEKVETDHALKAEAEVKKEVE